MTVLEKIKRCVSLVWDFQEFYGDEDIEDFCSNELDTYSQYNEILDYFKRITELEQENKVLAQNLEDTEIVNKALEKENAELKEKYVKNITDCDICDTYCNSQLTKAKELLKKVLDLKKIVTKAEEYLLLEEAEQFLNSEVKK